MNLLTWILLTMAVAAPVALCWIVLVQIPSLAHSRYRHELWDIHDDILETIYADRLSPSRTVLGLLDDIDALIRNSECQTVVRLSVARRAVAGGQVLAASPITSDKALLAGDVPPCEHQYVLQVVQRVRGAMRLHLRSGSVVGWSFALAARLRGARTRDPLVDGLYSTDLVVCRSLVSGGAREYFDGPHLKPVR